MILRTTSIEESGPNVLTLVSYTGSAGSSSSEEWGRMNVTETTLSSAIPRYEIQSGLAGDTFAITTDTPDVVNVSDAPIITRNSEGRGRIQVNNGRRKRDVTLDFLTVSSGAATRELTGAVADTYAEFSEDIIVAKMDAGGSNALFAAGEYNSSCWASEFDFTGVPYSNGSAGFQKGGANITPQHLLGAAHFSLSIGDVITCKPASGPSISRTVVGRSQVVNGLTSDIAVYALSAAWPETIAHYPLAGEWIFSRSVVTGGFQYWSDGTGVYLDQFRNVYRTSGMTPSAVYSFQSNGGTVGSSTFSGLWSVSLIGGDLPDYLSSYVDFTKNPVVGDSGSPVFAPLSETELCFHTVLGGPWFGPWLDEGLVNAMIVSANDNAVANGHARPTDYTVTVAPDPTL